MAARLMLLMMMMMMMMLLLALALAQLLRVLWDCHSSVFEDFHARIGRRRSETATMVVERIVVALAPSTSAVVSVVALEPLTDDDS